VPDYPAVPQPTATNTELVLRKLREIVEVLLRRQADVGKSVVTVQDLLDLGLITHADANKLRSGR
jgi:hypothetical protein